MKYQGTGHADTTKFEWASDMQRDILASHVSHHSRLMYMAVAENESIARVRFNCLNKMVQPIPPPLSGNMDMDLE